MPTPWCEARRQAEENATRATELEKKTRMGRISLRTFYAASRAPSLGDGCERGRTSDGFPLIEGEGRGTCQKPNLSSIHGQDGLSMTFFALSDFSFFSHLPQGDRLPPRRPQR